LYTPVITGPTIDPIHYSRSNIIYLKAICYPSVGIMLQYYDSSVGLIAQPYCNGTPAGDFEATYTKPSDSVIDISFRTYAHWWSHYLSTYSFLRWVYDTTAPVMTGPTLTVSGQRVTATFSATDAQGVWYYECQVDGGPYKPCSSPFVMEGMPNGSAAPAHTFNVRAVDRAGNTSTVGSATWNQSTSNSTQAYSTLALYHLDDILYTTDFSGYGASTLTDVGSTSGSGKSGFGQARTISTSGGKYIRAAHHTSQNNGLSNSMSVEAYIYPTAAASVANTYIVNKSGASSDYGWYLGYRANPSSGINLVFGGSLSGSGAAPTQVASPSTCSMTPNTWMHVSVVWNNGVIKFYCDGVFKGMGYLGTPGSAALNASGSTLNIGRNEATSPVYFEGLIDEVRITQFPRDIGITYPLPTIPNTPD
jgi:hypothetical protein